MAEYITKSQVRDIMAAHYPYATLREETAMFHINKELMALPAAAVVEVVRGEWVEDEYGFIHCSQCLMEWDEPEHPETNYCPHCGAKMDGERKDGADNG